MAALAEAVFQHPDLAQQVKVTTVVTVLLEEVAAVAEQAVLVVMPLPQKTVATAVQVQLQAFLVLASHTLVEEVEAVVVQAVVLVALEVLAAVEMVQEIALPAVLEELILAVGQEVTAVV
jgi:hypothetical protein